ncbi:helix-turn-helix transcriptional regulator [Streptomyces purpurascens]|uniref:helix-turn-helix domain-containing protein n=1 Tax=Streptomyces purpurascens TaxID=1924 RepID=UPI0033E689F5
MGEVVDGGRESGRGVLGRTLKFLREQAGKSLGYLADDTGYDKSYLSRLEKGERLSKRAVMEDLDSYYGSGDLLVTLCRMAQLDAFKNKYKEVHGAGGDSSDPARIHAGRAWAVADRGVRPRGVVWAPDNGRQQR